MCTYWHWGVGLDQIESEPSIPQSPASAAPCDRSRVRAACSWFLCDPPYPPWGRGAALVPRVIISIPLPSILTSSIRSRLVCRVVASVRVCLERVLYLSFTHRTPDTGQCWSRPGTPDRRSLQGPIPTQRSAVPKPDRPRARSLLSSCSEKENLSRRGCPPPARSARR